MIIFDASCEATKQWVSLSGQGKDSEDAPAVLMKPLNWIELHQIEKESEEVNNEGNAYINYYKYWQKIIDTTEPEAWRGVVMPDGTSHPFREETLFLLISQTPIVARHLKNELTALAIGLK